MSDGKDDPLIGALLTKLPKTGSAWSRAARVNWLRMLVMALNEAYGLEEAIAVGETLFTPPAGLRLVKPIEEIGGALVSGAGGAVPAQPRYVIDSEGFAMCGVRPIAPEDIPAGAILWDERPAGDRGDLGSILWKGEGARAPEKLPKLDVRAA